MSPGAAVEGGCTRRMHEISPRWVRRRFAVGKICYIYMQADITAVPAFSIIVMLTAVVLPSAIHVDGNDCSVLKPPPHSLSDFLYPFPLSARVFNFTSRLAFHIARLPRPQPLTLSTPATPPSATASHFPILPASAAMPRSSVEIPTDVEASDEDIAPTSRRTRTTRYASSDKENATPAEKNSRNAPSTAANNGRGLRNLEPSQALHQQVLDIEGDLSVYDPDQPAHERREVRKGYRNLQRRLDGIYATTPTLPPQGCR